MAVAIKSMLAAWYAGLDGQATAPCPPWLSASWQEPEVFASALWSHAVTTQPAFSADGWSRVTLYHDLLLRHLPARGAGPIAWRDAAGTLSYAALHARCEALAAHLLSQGLQPGAALVLLLPFGADLLVALLAALRLGLCAVPILPTAPLWVERRLALVKDARIYTIQHHYLLRGAARERCLPAAPTAAPAAPLPPPHCYAADAECLRLWPSLTQRPAAPLALRAGALLHGCLRDGLFALALRPGDTLAAPDLPAPRYQPTLLLTALLHGATFAHLPLDTLRGGASWPALRTLVASDTLCQALLQAGKAPCRVELILRDPAGAPAALKAWHELLRLPALKKVACGNLVYDGALGGVLLAAPPRRGAVSQDASPVVGRAFALQQIAADAPALSGIGRYQPLPPPALPPLDLLLQQGDAGYLCAGAVLPRRGGLPFPGEDVRAAAGALPGVLGSAVIVVPQAQGGARVHLLCYCGAEAAPTREVVAARLAEALGPAALPDEIDVLRLYPPRGADGALDAERARYELSYGLLHIKGRLASLQPLNQLRRLLAPPLGAAP